METVNVPSTKKRLTLKRVAAIAFLVFAALAALIGWAISMVRPGYGPTADPVVNAIGLTNYVHVALAFSLLFAFIAVVMALFDLADKQ
jgi:hypothetical protein